MNAITLKTPAKNIIIGIFAVMMVFLFDSCAQNYPFLSSSVVPAARGAVTVKRDKNKNYAVQINVTNLAEVERLQPSKQSYVVWMVTDQDVTNNIGQLKSSAKLFSRTLTGSFKTISSSRPSKIFITAENDPGIQYPGNQVVLSTDRFQQ